jgi:hypothetical protein
LFFLGEGDKKEIAKRWDILEYIERMSNKNCVLITGHLYAKITNEEQISHNLHK